MKSKQYKEPEFKEYTHKEISSLYFPHLSVKSASQRLTRTIKEYDEMREDLLKAGYRTRQRNYSTLQVDILVRYLGPPREWVQSKYPLYG